MGPDGPQTTQKEIRPMLLQAHLCCLSIVFEAIMTKRLMSWAEYTDKLPTEQSGFRKHHSTNDKLFDDCLGAWAPYF